MCLRIFVLQSLDPSNFSKIQSLGLEVFGLQKTGLFIISSPHSATPTLYFFPSH